MCIAWPSTPESLRAPMWPLVVWGSVGWCVLCLRNISALARSPPCARRWLTQRFVRRRSSEKVRPSCPPITRHRRCSTHLPHHEYILGQALQSRRQQTRWDTVHLPAACLRYHISTPIHLLIPYTLTADQPLNWTDTYLKDRNAAETLVRVTHLLVGRASCFTVPMSDC